MKATIKQRTPRIILEMSMKQALDLTKILNCIGGGQGMPLHFDCVPEVDVMDARKVLMNVVDEIEEVYNGN